MDILAGKLLSGYNFSAQSMSEIGAVGSPTRSLVVTLSILASFFLIAFGIGVLWVSKSALLPCIVAGLIIGNAVFGLIAILYFPNQYGVRPEFQTPGVILMFFSVLCFMLAMILGAFAFQGWMRIISASIPAAYIFLAIIRFTTVKSSASGATTLIGTQERTMGYSFLVWVLALSIYILVSTRNTVDSIIR